MGRESAFEWIVLSPPGTPDVALPIAGSRAGAIGVVNLEFATDNEAALAGLSSLVALGRGRCGALVDCQSELLSELLSALLAERIAGLEVIVLANPDGARLADLVAAIHRTGCQAFSQATSLAEALAAEAAGVDAVIVKGHEAGGWIGSDSTFVLLQQCVTHLSTPVWAHGGIGLHTAAACYVAGVAGAVLDSQLLLARESPLPEPVKDEIRGMDGSETVCVGSGFGEEIRIFTRPALSPVAELQQAELSFALAATAAEDQRVAWRAAVRPRIGWSDLKRSVLAVGQDTAFAAPLAARFSTVGGILAGLNSAIAGSAGASGAATHSASPPHSPILTVRGMRSPRAR